MAGFVHADPQWYRHISLFDVHDMPWMEHTQSDINEALDNLELNGNEKILDIACGNGRHAVALAKRGYQVVGVDVNADLIDIAQSHARQIGVSVNFICTDLRDLTFDQEFDVVLGLYGGAIGYFETEQENLRTFEVISAALRAGGKHFAHFLRHPGKGRTDFPVRTWNRGKKMIELCEIEWDEDQNILHASAKLLRYGEMLNNNEFMLSSKRVYSLAEISSIMKRLQMEIMTVDGQIMGDVTPTLSLGYWSILSQKSDSLQLPNSVCKFF